MDIKSSVLFYLLSNKYPDRLICSGDQDCEIETAHVYHGQAIENKVLYILPPNANIPSVPKSSRCSFIQCDATQCPPVEEQQLLEDAFEMMQGLYRWDCDLKDALLTNISLSEFFRLGERMLEHAHALIDKDFAIIAYSSKYIDFAKSLKREESPDNPEGYSDDHLFQIPSSVADELIMDDEFQSSTRYRHVFIYPSKPHRHHYICENLFSAEQQFQARFLVCLPNYQEGADLGEIQLFSHFSSYLKEIYKRYSGENFTPRQNDPMHTLVRSMILGSRESGRDSMASTLNMYGWGKNDEFSVVKFSFFKGASWEMASLYICQLLENEWENSCAIRSGRSIIWVFNHSMGNIAQNEDTLTKSLVRIIREYLCKAGISDTFHDFEHIKNYHKQAETALVTGQNRDPHFWYYKFGDYIFDYMQNQMTKEFSADQICHKGLQKLVGYDKKNATDYVHTLYCYLLNDRNSTHTAEQLFIHRTSFLRRLDRIKKITGIDFDDKDEVLHILLSYKLMHIM